jgi:hypothetical protein
MAVEVLDQVSSVLGVAVETLVVVVDFVILASPVDLTVVSGILVEQSSMKTCWP